LDLSTPVDKLLKTMDAKQIWTEITAQLEKDLGKDTIDLWFQRVKPVSLDGSILKLEIPNQMWYETLRTRYEEKMLSCARNISGTEITLEYTLAPSVPSQPAVRSREEEESTEHHQSHAAFPNRLTASYTFDAFIEGPSNRFACKAAQAAVKRMGERANNPLFIYSNPGLGKTHLLHAVGNEIIKNNARAKVLCMSGEEFVNEYIESLQNKRSESFRSKYRNLDCFLVDDIQFLLGSGRERSEQEFFYTFNALFESKKQIVLTSDRAPGELQIEERLASRLLSGIVAEMKVPDVETRIAILRQKRDILKLAISDDVLAFMGTHMKSSIREMEGGLVRLNVYCQSHNAVPTPDIAKEVLSDMIRLSDRAPVVSIDSIKKIVAKHYSLAIEDFTSSRRSESIAFPRQIAMYLACEMTELSLPEIGKAFEKDHSTVVHSRKRISRELEQNPFFVTKINEIRNEVLTVDSL